MVEKISLRKGSNKKTAQKHQNQTAFRHNKNSKLTRKIASLPIDGVCEHCREILNWRKSFRKYKPLTCPKKCVQCFQKTIKEAYHVVCRACASEKNICSKCLNPFGSSQLGLLAEKDLETQRSQRIVDLLQTLSERHRRSFLRKRESCDDGSQLDDLIDKFSGLASESVDDDDDFSDFSDSDDDDNLESADIDNKL